MVVIMIVSIFIMVFCEDVPPYVVAAATTTTASVVAGKMSQKKSNRNKNKNKNSSNNNSNSSHNNTEKRPHTRYTLRRGNNGGIGDDDDNNDQSLITAWMSTSTTYRKWNHGRGESGRTHTKIKNRNTSNNKNMMSLIMKQVNTNNDDGAGGGDSDQHILDDSSIDLRSTSKATRTAWKSGRRLIGEGCTGTRIVKSSSSPSLTTTKINNIILGGGGKSGSGKSGPKRGVRGGKANDKGKVSIGDADGENNDTSRGKAVASREESGRLNEKNIFGKARGGGSGERSSGKGEKYYGGKRKAGRRRSNTRSNTRRNYNGRQRGRSRQRRTVQIGVYSCEYHKGETCCSEVGDTYDDKVCCKDDFDARNKDANHHKSSSSSSSKDRTTQIDAPADDVSSSDGDDSPAIFLDRGVVTSSMEEGSPSNDW